MPLTAPLKVPEDDIIRNFKVAIDHNADLMIVDGEATDTGFRLPTLGGEEIEVDLTARFLTRAEYLLSQGNASLELADEETEGFSESKPLSAAAMRRLLNTYLKNTADGGNPYNIRKVPNVLTKEMTLTVTTDGSVPQLKLTGTGAVVEWKVATLVAGTTDNYTVKFTNVISSGLVWIGPAGSIAPGMSFPLDVDGLDYTALLESTDN